MYLSVLSGEMKLLVCSMKYLWVVYRSPYRMQGIPLGTSSSFVPPAPLENFPGSAQLDDFPVFRQVAQRLHAGGLQPDVGVEAPGDGLLDDGLPFLLQQGNEPLLGAHVFPDALVGIIEVLDDGGLLIDGRYGKNH